MWSLNLSKGHICNHLFECLHICSYATTVQTPSNRDECKPGPALPPKWGSGHYLETLVVKPHEMLPFLLLEWNPSGRELNVSIFPVLLLFPPHFEVGRGKKSQVLGRFLHWIDSARNFSCKSVLFDGWDKCGIVVMLNKCLKIT